jgi:hypothetical protein
MAAPQELKSEGRKPKSEGSPKSEVPKDQPGWRLVRSAIKVLFGFRASDLVWQLSL